MLVLATLALAVDPPLKGAAGTSNCLRIPCTGIVADPTAGIVPADIVQAIGQGERTDLAWTPADIAVGDGVFSGYLVAEDDGTGNLDTSGGIWFYGTALLDSDTTDDVLAGRISYDPGVSLDATLDVMFDQGTAAWAPRHTLSVHADYASGGSAAAPVYGWVLSTMSLTEGERTVYATERQSVDIDLAVGGITYRLTQRTASALAVTVEEALDWFYDGYLYSASSVGGATRSGSTVGVSTTWSDGAGAEAVSSSSTANSREVRRNESNFLLGDGSVRQTTIGTRGGARVSVVTTSEIDLTAGHSTSYAVAPAESLTITSYPLAGVAPGNPFVSMMRTVGDQ